MRRCYVNKPVRHVQPPPFYPRQTSDTQSEAYLPPLAVKLLRRANQPALFTEIRPGLPACTYRHPFAGKLLHPFMNEFGFEYSFGFFTVPDTVFITLIFGPVNFAHPRINSSQHAGCAVLRHAPCAIVISVETPIIGNSAPSASPCAMPIPMRTPVKLPGPRPYARAFMSVRKFRWWSGYPAPSVKFVEYVHEGKAQNER